MIRTLVLYYSKTGNTEKVAEAIFRNIPENKKIMRFSDKFDLADFDLIFVGFPIYNFGPIGQAKEFITNSLQGRNIALFMTMSLTAAPASDQVKELYDLTIQSCRACAEKSNVLGIFDCPGELSESAADALLKSEDPMLRMFGSVRHISIGFPNEKNIEEAEAFAREILLKFPGIE